MLFLNLLSGVSVPPSPRATERKKSTLRWQNHEYMQAYRLIMQRQLQHGTQRNCGKWVKRSVGPPVLFLLNLEKKQSGTSKFFQILKCTKKDKVDEFVFSYTNHSM